jgi:hypothetical protein
MTGEASRGNMVTYASMYLQQQSLHGLPLHRFGSRIVMEPLHKAWRQVLDYDFPDKPFTGADDKPYG